MNIFRRRKGVTLVELIMVVFILSVGIAGTLLLFVNSMLSSEFAWDLTVATSHAEYVLEEMQLKDTLQEVTAVNWPQWSQSQGLSSLPQETLQVAFVDKERNPLEIEVKVNWVRKSRENNVTLKTKLTR